MNIFYTDRFAKDYKKLPNNIKTLTEKREEIFRQNPHEPRLKTHKLKGKLKKFYSFSIDYHYRIVFHYKSENKVIFDTIGTHEIYK